MTNPEWGALGFLTKQPEPEIASKSEASAGSSGAELRVAEARKLNHNNHGYRSALNMDCWLSRSRKGGAVAIEEMDTAYITNTVKMIGEGRHPVVDGNKDTSLADAWLQRLERELFKRGEVPF